METKVLSLFGNNKIAPNNGVKYSDLLNDFIQPFENDFPEGYDLGDVISFSMNAWNFGNISLLVPEKEFKRMLASSPGGRSEITILKKLIKRKTSEFKEHDRFIVDFTLKEDNGKLNLTVVTEDKEAYLETMMNEMEDNVTESDFEEGYIDRYAIVLKPLQPFFDWIINLSTEYPLNGYEEASVYLIEDEIDDMEKWLRTKYDRFFIMELENWQFDKKNWPQKRSYKIFKQWFEVTISSDIYDTVKKPIRKVE